MTHTNKYNIPHAIVSAVLKSSEHTQKSDISVTQLIQPPRLLQLRRRHADKITFDISDRVWSLLGQSVHSVLQLADDHGAMHEERLQVQINGWTVSGRTDSFVENEPVYDNTTGQIEWKKIPPTVRDYKLIKVMAADFPHPEWEQQLNLLAFLWRAHGFSVASLQNVLIFRDWSPSMYKLQTTVRKRDYPPPIKIVQAKLWDPQKAETFIHYRVRLHQSAVTLSDEMLPFCTPEEQWRKAHSWAVKTPSRQSALKVFNNKDAALNFIKANHHRNAYIEFRPAAAVRCESYCEAAPFCNQKTLEATQGASVQEEAV